MFNAFLGDLRNVLPVLLEKEAGMPRTGLVRLLLTGKDYWVGGGINANLQGGSGLEEHAGSPSGWDSGSPQEMMAKAARAQMQP